MGQISELLKVGDILNTRFPNAYSLNNILWWVFKRGCHEYQRDMFPLAPDKKSLWTTHTRLYLGNGEWLSVTTPKGIIEKIDLDNKKGPWALCRYQYINSFDKPAIDAMIKMAHSFVGVDYDYPQIAGMALHALFPNLISENSSLVSGNKNKVVCSVGALASLIAGWKLTDRSLPRPCGNPLTEDGGIFVEIAPPAAFMNHESTFKVIFKYRW